MLSCTASSSSVATTARPAETMQPEPAEAAAGLLRGAVAKVMKQAVAT